MVTLAPGASAERIITLRLGSLREELTVTCTGSTPLLQGLTKAIGKSLFAVLSAQERPAAPVRVGGSIRQPRKIHDVRPTCPAATLSGETTVWLVGQVGTDGLMHEVTPVPGPGGQAPVEFVESAVDAVRQWKFTPTLLNNAPVQIDISVMVVFRRS